MNSVMVKKEEKNKESYLMEVEIKCILEDLPYRSHVSWGYIQKNSMDVFEKNSEEKIKIELVLKEIERCVEDRVKYIEDNLPLTDILLKEHLPFLINQSVCQLTRLLNDMGESSFIDDVPSNSNKNINNFFIRTMLYQMNYLESAHPLALLIWIVILFRIGRLLYSNLYNKFFHYINLHWKKMALHWISGELKTNVLVRYQFYLSSYLVDSIGEHID